MPTDQEQEYDRYKAAWPEPSLTQKKTSISMCLERLWKIGLWAMGTALWLSQKSTGVAQGICNFVSRVEIHESSVEVYAILLYFASVLSTNLVFARPPRY